MRSNVLEIINNMKDLKEQYVEVLTDRMNWCANTERYELAAGYRDAIKNQTTDDEEWKEQYYYKLCKKYSPEFLHLFKPKNKIS